VTRRRSALTILFVIVFVDLLGFGMVIPVIPLYAEKHFGASVGSTGWLLSGYSAMQFVFTPIWGRLSDRWGRRPLLLGSIFMTGVAFLGYGLAPSFGWLLASRVFAGFATANIAIAQAYIADVTAPEERARGMGLIGAAFGLGFVLGPGIGGILSGFSMALPGYAAAGLAFANGVAALALLPEPAERSRAPGRAGFRELLEELGKPGIRRLIAVYFFSVTAFSAMEGTFALLAEHRYGLDQRHVNWVFAFFGVVVVLVQGGLIGRLTRRFGEARLLLAGLLLQVVAFLLLPWSPGVVGLYAACVPLAVGSGLATPSLTALLSRSAREDDQGGTLGMGQSAAALGRIVGPISATAAFGKLGFAAPYVGGAALLFLGAGIGSTLRPRAAETEPPTA
jgi:predicted MFS family arabinose efflux permease